MAETLASQPWVSTDSRLAANSACHAALDHLVLTATRPLQRSSALRIRSGLSAQARRRVIDWVEAHFPDDFTLSDLAAPAVLSEFHFARMFRVSMGVAPHAWLAQRRFARACELLSRRVRYLSSIERVATACGYANASHLHRHFRRELGMTPVQYRNV